MNTWICLHCFNRTNKFVFLRSFDCLGTMFIFLRFDPKKLSSFLFRLRSSCSLRKLSFHFVLANFFHTTSFLSTPAVCPRSQMPLLHLDVSTPQELELHLNLYGKQEQVLLLEVPTPQRPELYMYVTTHRSLSCTWTCLHYRGQSSTWTCLCHWGLSCTWTFLETEA